MVLLGAVTMKFLTNVGRGVSGLLLISILMLYSGLAAQAESDSSVSLASTAAWWSEEWGQSQSIAWGDVDGDGDLVSHRTGCQP